MNKPDKDNTLDAQQITATENQKMKELEKTICKETIEGLMEVYKRPLKCDKINIFYRHARMH